MKKCYIIESILIKYSKFIFDGMKFRKYYLFVNKSLYFNAFTWNYFYIIIYLYILISKLVRNLNYIV